MAEEQTPINPSDPPSTPPSGDPAPGVPQASSPPPDAMSEIAKTIEQSEQAAETLAQDIKKGPAPPELSAKATDMLAAVKAAVAAAQSHQASGGGPLPTPQPDMSEAMSAFADPVGAPVALPDYSSKKSSSPAVARDIDLLADVNLNVNIELGRTRMLVEDVLRLGEGSVVELDKLAGDPVDVFVNGRHVARGEVLVVNDNFCVRISEILSRVPGSED